MCIDWRDCTFMPANPYRKSKHWAIIVGMIGHGDSAISRHSVDVTVSFSCAKAQSNLEKDPDTDIASFHN